MPVTIDPETVYSDSDLVAMGIGRTTQENAIRSSQLKTLRNGVMTYSGAEVRRFLGLGVVAQVAKAVASAKPAPSAPPARRASQSTYVPTPRENAGQRAARLINERIQQDASSGQRVLPAASVTTEGRKMNSNYADHEFVRRVEQKVAAGMTRSRATAQVVKEDPELHAEYVQWVNSQRPARR